jgi:hypothetical protein
LFWNGTHLFKAEKEEKLQKIHSRVYCLISGTVCTRFFLDIVCHGQTIALFNLSLFLRNIMAIVRNCQTISSQNLTKLKNNTFGPCPDEPIRDYLAAIQA